MFIKLKTLLILSRLTSLISLLSKLLSLSDASDGNEQPKLTVAVEASLKILQVSLSVSL